MLLYDKIKAVLREQEVDDSYALIRALEEMIETELQETYSKGRNLGYSEGREDGYDAGHYAAHSEFNHSMRDE